MSAEKKTRGTDCKYGHAKNLPSYMQPTESSSNKTREKIYNTCMSTRMKSSCGDRMASFGDAPLEYVKKEARSMQRRKVASRSFEEVPRYMLPTESSAKKSLEARYKLSNRPPRIPSGSLLNNNLTASKDEQQRVQMSNVAMDPFVESLRRGSSSDRTDLDRPPVEKRHSSRSLRRSYSKESSDTDTSDVWLKETKNLPRYQQPTVLASLRAHGRTRA